jgi:tetratricopeptide (TPR) repeat protein
MKVLALVLFTTFLTAGIAFSQNDHKITTGIVACESGDYVKAEEALRIGLSDEKKIKAKYIGKGWYYMGKTMMGIMHIASTNKDAKLLEKFPTAMLDGFDSYKKAIEKDDEKQRYAKLAKKDLELYFNSFLSTGMLSLNSSNYDEVLPYLNAAEYISKNVLAEENYMVYDFRAQVFLGKADSVSAQKDFLTAIDVFTNHPPKRPDQLVAYVYYRCALIARYKDKDSDQALKYIRSGTEMLEKEHNRLTASDYDTETWERLSIQYQEAKADLSAFELDILLNSPDKLKEALTQFENAVKAEPNNYIKHVAYAQLLEKVNPEKSIEVYEKAIKIDESKQMAIFNLGALYVNKAAAASRAMNETADVAEADRLEKEVVENFKKALPLLEKAHAITPKDLSTIRALKQITIYLGMNEDYNKYKAAEQAVTGG